MPVNPDPPPSNDDIRDCLAEMAQYALGGECARLNNSVRSKWGIYAAGNLVPWACVGYDKGLRDMWWEVFLTLSIAALVYGVYLAVARTYTVRMHARVSSDFTLMILAWRPYAAPTADEIDRLVQFVAPPRILAKWTRDSPALEYRCVAQTESICALWKTQQLYKLLQM